MTVTGGASFSVDRRYRYRLWRRWDRSRPAVAFCMLNPSTADERRDDPTVRRCVGFARAWGFGGIDVLNLFALRASDPRTLRAAPDPVGPRNDEHIVRATMRAGLIVVAWGARGGFLDRDRSVLGLLGRLAHPACLGWTQGGHPRHPLYVRNDARPRRFAGRPSTRSGWS